MEQTDPTHARFFSDIRQRRANGRPAASTPIVLVVTWVDQSEHPDPCQRITHIGGRSGKFQWKHTHAQAIQSIEQGLFAYHVEKDARALKLEVELSSNGRKFLKTKADADQPLFLLGLPGGPKPAPL